jgi:hypothetical protein
MDQLMLPIVVGMIWVIGMLLVTRFLGAAKDEDSSTWNKDVMKGILIDPAKKSVEAVESESFDLSELHKLLLGAETLDFCHPFGKTETVAVDDNGMSRELPHFFIEGFRWPIFGRAVIMGRGSAGGRSRHLSVEEVFDLITFT